MYVSQLVVMTAMVLGSACSAELPGYRLPGDLIPHHYNLSILTDLENFVFTGKVDIQIECKTNTELIKLHSVALSVADKDITLKKLHDNKEITIREVSRDSKNDFLIIKVAEQLVAGSSYLLHIPFKGNLTDSLAGYYRSSYQDKATNTTKWLAVTQFEPTDARRAFPCFDEPAMKAKFHIRLGHKEHLNSISNMPLSTSYTEDGWVWDEYMDTVPMSTYLVAFIVSDFEFKVSDPEPNKVLFRVWARKAALDQVEFTRKYGPKFLNFFESFFNVKYPLPKQDMIAIPDFSAGAMENWGLITYRESQVLLDENETSVAFKYHIANTVAHELAHQWFGNLVTMKWWTDLWLNEGFATYVASLAIDHEFPEWNGYNFDVAENIFRVFSLDALESSHPVSVPIGHPSEVNQIFDAISYSKGSLLLHMINSFLGKDVFQAGVSEYLKKFAYGNSEQDDLWAALTIEAGKKQVLPPGGVSVKDIMDKWTLQTGYPVLNITRNIGSLTITQKRFLAIPPKAGVAMKGCWWIPLTYYTSKNTSYSDTRSSHWMSCETPELTFDTGVGSDDWIVFNNKAAGIYRVNYDLHSWNLLIDVLYSDLTKIGELNRLQLILDAMALAHTGELDYSVALKLLKYARIEPAYQPWRAVSLALSELENVLWRTEKYPQFQKLVRTLFEVVYQKFSDLESEPSGVETVRHKVLVTKWACDFQVADCTNKAAKLFQAWMTSDTNPIPKDLRSVVYCEGVRQGAEAEWNYVWKKYQESNIATEKKTFLRVLSCTQQKELLSRYLEWSVDSSSGVRSQDAATVFSNVAHNSHEGYRLAHEFLERNFQRIHDYFAPNTQEMGHYISTLSQRMVFPEEVDKLKKFVNVNQKLFEKSKLVISQALETADSNLVWMAKFYDKIQF